MFNSSKAVIVLLVMYVGIAKFGTWLLCVFLVTVFGLEALIKGCVDLISWIMQKTGLTTYWVIQPSWTRLQPAYESLIAALVVAVYFAVILAVASLLVICVASDVQQLHRTLL